MWYAVSKNSRNNGGLEEIYEGHYQFAMMWTPADDLQRVLDKGIPSIEELKELDPEALRKIYFNPEKIDFLVRSAEDMGQTGKLEFRMC